MAWSELEQVVADHLAVAGRDLAVDRLRRRRWRTLLAVSVDRAEAGLAAAGGALLGLALGVALGVPPPITLLLAVWAVLAALAAVALISITEAADRAVTNMARHLPVPDLLDAVDRLGPIETTALARLRRP